MEARIDRRFEAEAEVGRGAMGVVYRAIDHQTGALVALKVLAHTEGSSAQRFELEARLLDALSHPAIVRYVAHGRAADGSRYLAMEWLDGEDLRARLARGVLEERQALALAARIGDGLAAAHQGGVVHRDVKPSNIFLPGGRLEDAKLIDFGVARVAGESSGLTRSGIAIGTPAYMSPEQVRGDSHIDGRADVFALGVVLFEMLAGRTPFRGKTSVAIMAKIVLEEAPRLVDLQVPVAAAVDDVVRCLLARERNLRPADMNEVAATLRTLAMGGHAPPLAGGPTDSSALGRDEGRLVCVVLVTPPSTASPAPDQATVLETSGDGRTEAALAPDRLSTMARRHGVRIEPLLDGQLATLLTGPETAVDLASRGARWALALREVAPEARLSLALAPVVLSRPLALDGIIETVAGLAAAPAPVARGVGVRLDAASAGLVGAGFQVEHDAHGAVLVGHVEEDGERRLLGRPTPFVGRVRELRQVRDVLRAWTVRPHGHAVVVTGPPGIGKSRLVAEVLRAEALGDAERWSGRGDPLRQGTAFGLLSQVVRDAAGIIDGLDADAARERLAAMIDHLATDDAARVVEFLGVLIGLPRAGAESPLLEAARGSPQLLADQVQRAFEDLVLAATTDRPLLLRLDDLHWADTASLRLIDAALRVTPTAPFLLVAVARPELDTLHPGLFSERAHTRLALDELTRGAAEKLLVWALGERAAPSLIERLAEQAAGNPFLLEELVRASADGRAGEVPGSVVAMAMVRLDALDATARRVLRAASIFGEAFWPAGVARLLRGDSTEVDRVLAELVAGEWVRPLRGGGGGADRQLVFVHSLLREAAYASLTEADRALGHLLAAEWLRDRGRGEPAVLALHYERGGDRGHAASCHAQAAELALAASDRAGALAHVEESLRCGVRGIELGEVRLVEAHAQHWGASHELQRRAALEAVRLLAPLEPHWYRAIDTLAEASLPLGDVAALEALATAVAPPPWRWPAAEEAHLACLAAVATVVMQLVLAGRRASAAAAMDRLEAWCAATEHVPALVRARVEFARMTIAVVAGDFGGMLAFARRAIAAYEEAGDRRNGALMRSNEGFILAEVGAWGEAEATLRDAIRIGERMDLPFVLGATRMNLGLVLGRQGRVDDARVLERDVVTFFAGAGHQRAEGEARVYLASIELAAGDAEAAEREARAAVVATATMPPTRCMALGALAQTLLAQARHAEAAAAAAEAHALFASLGAIDEGEALVRLMRAETLLATGDRPGATAAAAAALAALDARAAKISDPTWRESFLGRVPENARTRALAAELGVAAAAAAAPAASAPTA